jgi:S1-C subfamily serine protease
MSRRQALLASSTGAIVALAVVAVLALVGVFDSGDGGSGRFPSVPVARGAQGGSGRIHAIYQQESPGVAFVQARVVEQQTSPFGIPQRQQGIATGSGIVLDEDGHILTNAHVVENASDIKVHFKSGDFVPARVVGRDVGDDLALLEVNPSKTKLTPLPLGDSSRAEVGEPVVAIGNPLGLADTITAGIVSAKQRFIKAPNGFTIDNVIQTDAAVNPGNSGGPLIDYDGKVIGINSQIATAPQGGGNGFIGIAFAIPINTAKQVIPQLEQNGRVETAYLGVSTLPVTPTMATQFGLGVRRGALIVAVAPGSPAAKVGLRGGGGSGGAITGGGDVIVRVGNRPVNTPDDLASAIRDRRPGQQVQLQCVRGGRRHSVTVRLAARPS